MPTTPFDPTAAHVPITVTDVRRLAIANNLDIKVEVLNPSISKENLSQEEAVRWTLRPTPGLAPPINRRPTSWSSSSTGTQAQNWH
jgi:hypothetical protein